MLLPLMISDRPVMMGDRHRAAQSHDVCSSMLVRDPVSLSQVVADALQRMNLGTCWTVEPRSRCVQKRLAQMHGRVCSVRKATRGSSLGVLGCTHCTSSDCSQRVFAVWAVSAADSSQQLFAVVSLGCANAGQPAGGGHAVCKRTGSCPMGGKCATVCWVLFSRVQSVFVRRVACEAVGAYAT